MANKLCPERGWGGEGGSGEKGKKTYFSKVRLVYVDLILYLPNHESFLASGAGTPPSSLLLLGHLQRNEIMIPGRHVLG